MGSVTMEVIRAGLTGRVQELAMMLAPGGRVDGHEYWALNPTRPDKRIGSFKIDLSGSRAGGWYEFAERTGGDLIGLIAYCRFGHLGRHDDGRGEAVKAAIIWAKSFLCLDDADPEFLAKAEARAARHAKSMEQVKASSERDQERKSSWARREWVHCMVSAWDHPVSLAYLKGARGIDPALLSHVGGGLKCEFEGPPWKQAPHDQATGEVFPAICSAMIRLNGGKGFDGVRAVHRTFLAPDGSGKADMPKAKRMYGAARGCAIRLTKGASRMGPELASRKGVRDDVLAISEGIEDGLTWAMIEPTHRVWAAGSLSLIGAVEVPACVKKIVLVGQNDDGEAARSAFDGAVAQLIASSGRPCEIVNPPSGQKDWNDWWRAQA